MVENFAYSPEAQAIFDPKFSEGETALKPFFRELVTFRYVYNAKHGPPPGRGGITVAAAVVPIGAKSLPLCPRVWCQFGAKF